jgi:hypothetical protein
MSVNSNTRLVIVATKFLLTHQQQVGVCVDIEQSYNIQHAIEFKFKVEDTLEEGKSRLYIYDKIPENEDILEEGSDHEDNEEEI